MWTHNLEPRFADTDALGHINNAAILSWFESGRRPLFKIFTPDLDPKKWKLIIAKIEIAYQAQLNYEPIVEVNTWVSRIGNSSFDIKQTISQENHQRSELTCTMVHFDYVHQKSTALTNHQIEQLTLHLE